MKQDIDVTLILIMLLLAATLGVLMSIALDIANIAKHLH